MSVSCFWFASVNKKNYKFLIHLFREFNKNPRQDKVTDEKNAHISGQKNRFMRNFHTISAILGLLVSCVQTRSQTTGHSIRDTVLTVREAMTPSVRGSR